MFWHIKLKTEIGLSWIWRYLVKNALDSLPLKHYRIVWWCLNSKQVKLWTLINLMNNIVVVLVCVKCLKLIPSEENIISVQQLSGCLPLFFVFSSEVLKSGGKSCFDRDVFQDAVMLHLRVVFLLRGKFPYALLL